MAEKYKSGGILAALHNSSTNEAKMEVGENTEEQNVLADLFAKVSEENTSEDEEDNDAIEDVLLKTEFESSLLDKSKSADDEAEPKKKKKVKIEETPERLERTLFVGNVALTVTRKTLRKLFNKFGELETIRFRSFVGADMKTPRKVALIKKTFHAECKSMNAYIVFKDKDSVGKALQCNGIVLEGLHIRVDRASASKENKTKQCVFVGNLPYNVSDEALHQHFQKCGAIEAVRAVRDKLSGMGKGFGYVTFKASDAVLFALKLNASTLDGREIRVYRATDTSQQQRKTQHGNNNNNDDKSFQGLKSTSKKDREFGKRLVQAKQTKSNAMRRLKGKMWDKKKVKQGKDSNNAKNKKGKMDKKRKMDKKGKGEKAKGRPRGSK